MFLKISHFRRKIKFISLKVYIKRKTQMLRHERPNGCGLRLPEDKKANMWHVVVYGRLPSPAPINVYLR